MLLPGELSFIIHSRPCALYIQFFGVTFVVFLDYWLRYLRRIKLNRNTSMAVPVMAPHIQIVLGMIIAINRRCREHKHSYFQFSKVSPDRLDRAWPCFNREFVDEPAKITRMNMINILQQLLIVRTKIGFEK